MRLKDCKGEVMKKIPVEEAVGMVIAHDMTKIIPGKYKGPAFKKGHIIRNEDVLSLKEMGKYNIFVFDIEKGYVHEDDAAFRIAQAIAGKNISFGAPSEGKITFRSTVPGLFNVDKEVLYQLNSITDVILSTVHTHTVVDSGTILAGTRVIPLVVDEQYLKEVEDLAENHGEILTVQPFKTLKVGIVVCGTEVYKGLVEDKFGEILAEKVKHLKGKVLGVEYVPDYEEEIVKAINKWIHCGAELVMVSGGMSVDPDDVTPLAIRKMATEVVRYGAPVLPGAMFMMAYNDDTPIVGVPGCGMYMKTTILDVILPRIFAGARIAARDIVELGHGGLCLNCSTCQYPVCPFAK